MMVVIGYDVQITEKEGANRLRRVAKECQNYGQRVQNSLFECVIDYQTFIMLKNKLLKIIDTKKDSLRFYLLGNRFKGRIEHYGIKETIDVTDTIII